MLPVTEGLLVAMLGTHLVLLVFVVWCLRRAALRIRRALRLVIGKMAGGQAGQYGLVVRGKTFTADQIDALDNTEIEKLYARYEARLGAAMTKTLGSAALQIYAGPWPCFSQSKTCQGLPQTSRATRLSGTRLAVLPASSTTATACSLHRLPLR